MRPLLRQPVAADRSDTRTRFRTTSAQTLNPVRAADKRSRLAAEIERLLDACASSESRRLAKVIAVHRAASLVALTSRIEQDAVGEYTPRSYSDEDFELALLLLRLSSIAALEALAYPLGLPSPSHVRRRFAHLQLIPSAAATEDVELLANLDATLGEALRDSPQLHYVGRPFLLSPTSSKHDLHQRNIERTMRSLVVAQWWLTHHGGGRIVSLARDGEPQGRRTLQGVCSGEDLRSSLPFQVARELEGLTLFEYSCGPNGIVFSCDWRHVFKRDQTWVGRTNGIRLGPVTIFPPEIRRFVAEHFDELSNSELDDVLYTGDAMNVPHATRLLDLLSQLTALPPPHSARPLPPTPQVRQQRQLLAYVAHYFYLLLSAFGDAEISLQVRLERLAEASFLLHFAFAAHGDEFCGSELAHDTQAFIRSIYVAVAHVKTSTPEAPFFIFHDGTDRLEELFGVVRTIVGNDSNVDVLQLAESLSHALQAAWVLEKRDLRPSNARRDLRGAFDHVAPRDITAESAASSVGSLRERWQLGLDRALAFVHKTALFPLPAYAADLSRAPDISVMRPHGTLIRSNPANFVKPQLALPTETDLAELYAFLHLHGGKRPYPLRNPSAGANSSLSSAADWSALGEEGLNGASGYVHRALNERKAGLSNNRLTRVQARGLKNVRARLITIVIYVRR
ncbi:hypothetical protein Rhopal_006569-T1 [Rhodotorula paludigena]|uniref:Uncharacterized protein n=1 Tax=Rhodotorula paludigena TaxID=86838 RepID=A0AAV5GVL6_9BASI|nr:hypothetical protein Rhopal_006569-T1 [Rhodotorula paludigena]